MFIEVKNAKKQYGTGEAAVYALIRLIVCGLARLLKRKG